MNLGQEELTFWGSMSTHERLISHRAINTSSNRSFGLVFTGFFAVIAWGPLLAGGAMRSWAAVLSICCLAAALLAPGLLAPFNHMWSRIGLILNLIVSPVVMGLIYAIVIVPTGLILKATGRDPLRLKWQPHIPSYWIDRRPPNSQPDSMSKQF
jgi:hypothetical protein